MNENIIYCLKSFSLRDKIIFHKGESYEYIIEGKSHLTDDASVYVFYNKNGCMVEQGYRFYILGKNMDNMRMICKANMTCLQSLKNGGDCKHSISHECNNPIFSLIKNYSCNCGVFGVLYLRKLKLEKLNKYESK